MNTSRTVILQNAVRSITTDRLFRDRWTSVYSLERAVNSRYKLEGLSTTKMAISKAIGRVEVGIQDLQVKNSSGIYSGLRSQMRYFFFQDPKLNPPYFPPTADNQLVWDEIIAVDQNNLNIYLDNLQKKKERVRPNKRERLDSVDIYDKISQSSAKVIKLSEDAAQSIVLPKNIYWDSPEAAHLFKPKHGESVLECLCRRDQLLSSAAFCDKNLLKIIDGIEDIDELINK